MEKYNDKKEKTTIELEDDEVAFIMNANQDVKFVMPHMEDEGNVPKYVQFVSAMVVVCTTDEEVIELIWKKFHDLVDEEKVN